MGVIVSEGLPAQRACRVVGVVMRGLSGEGFAQ